MKVIETDFLPVVVYNNQPQDRAVLKRFKEPAWNYQVVRFVDEKGKDIIPRKDKVWTLPALAKRMAEALEKHNRKVPETLRKLAS